MTLFEIIGILVLAIVLVTGIIIKRYTRQKLHDMDGLGGPIIANKKDADHLMHVE